MCPRQWQGFVLCFKWGQMTGHGLCLGWLLEGQAPLHGNAKVQPGIPYVKNIWARLKEASVSGVEGGWYVRTPAHEPG